MNVRDANARLDVIERLLREPKHRGDARLWQERLELLRVVDRANAPKEQRT